MILVVKTPNRTVNSEALVKSQFLVEVCVFEYLWLLSLGDTDTVFVSLQLYAELSESTVVLSM